MSKINPLDVIDATDTTGFNGGRLSASVLLIRDEPDGLKVWVQERVATMRNYPGHAVFPGGGVDPRDFPPRSWDSGKLWAGASLVSKARRLGVTKYKAHALVFAAARELFEEAGTLLVVDEKGRVESNAARFHAERLQLEGHELSFSDFLSQESLRMDSDRLLPWGRWVGHSPAGNWFDTFFFVATLPPGQEPDGNTGEAADAGWFPPQLLIDGWRAGLVRLVAPTWANLQRLCRLSSVQEVLDDVDYSDMRPVIGDPVDDPRYREFFTTRPVDRI
ncbi:NUDIX hydrolase [Corynebacterium sp. 32222D000AT]|uniref:NUDIX hydrolase n=1 Tax=Corynebacterium TaxID=1716 RepID=UPI0025B35770|nr:NUDIX domain-containing protein [Corynebacterium confusum]MDD7581554.1 NUDIX domain-containing protein [Mycobacteriaceae bacterium]MDY5829616.1 NUDIX domain-containing protein [Corynebacterium sp.]WJY89565.1 NUDIX domain protein [Corynebacterium confusum]